MRVQLEAVSTSAGFLKNAELEFAPGLTCIIGARGTCKSTVVESIRFAFDSDARKIEELCSSPGPPEQRSSNAGMIRATLGSGIAKCHVTALSPDGHDEITIGRELDARPSVFRNGIEELADLGVLHMVEIYSQGDLQQIAHDESLRLDLIDRPNKRAIADLENQRTQLAQQLKEVGTAIRESNRDIEARGADIRGLDGLTRQLDELQSQRPQLSAELDKERSQAEERKAIYEATRRGANEAAELVRQITTALEFQVDLIALQHKLGGLDDEACLRIADSFAEIERVRREVQQRADSLRLDELESSIEELKQVFEKKNQRYYDLRREQEEVSDSLKKEDGLKKQIQHLTELRRELDVFVVRRGELTQQRAQLRTQLQTLSDKIHRIRQKEVERINELHGEVVILTLELGVRSGQFADKLEHLLAGSGIRKQDEVAREISGQFRPCDLVDIVEAADAERLATTLDRDLRQMTRLISHLMDNPELYDLESILFEDSLEITLFDHGTPKSISELSNGQMATALLPLILRPAPYPLIFDQPEDDLDNSFIYRTLVQQIQQLKLERQLIFVTHNANIPVLGNADSIIVMEMESPTAASSPQIGSVDDMKNEILSLLEGGSEAFRLRHERYKDLVKDAIDDAASSSISP